MQHMPRYVSNIILGCVLLVICAFWPALTNGFVNWDDTYNFINNYFFRGIGFTNLTWAMSTRHLGVYQPLAWLLLETQYAIFGLSPWGFHAVSLILHTVNTLLMVIFAIKAQTLVRTERANRTETIFITLAVLLFGVHPLRVEAVAWASCQPYLLCLFFILASSICYLQVAKLELSDKSSRTYKNLMFVLYAAACLSKATAVFFPAMLLVLDYLWAQRLGTSFSFFKFMRARLPFVTSAALTAGLAVWARSEIHQSPNVLKMPLLHRLAYGDYALGLYLSKTVMPLGISNYYPPPNLLTAVGMLLILLPILSLGFGVLCFKKAPAVLFAFAVFTAALGANLGILQIGSTVASDRYTYVATAAALCILAFAPLPKRRLVAINYLVSVVIIGLVLATQTQCKIWHDSIALWSDALSKGGDGSEDVHNNLGLAHDEAGEQALAESSFLRAIAINPAYGLAHTNLAILYVKKARFEDAAKYFAIAVQLDPDSNEALNGLAYVKFLYSDLEAAATLNARALKLRPTDLSNLELNAQIETRRGNLAKAEESAKLGLRLDPNHASLLNTLGAIQFLMQQFSEAKISFERAIASKPNFVEPLLNLGDTLVKLGDAEGARSKYQAALAASPNNPRALSALSGGH